MCQDGTEHVTRVHDGEAASYAVLRAVAAVANRPIEELAPLGEVVDTDALDHLHALSSTEVSLQFDYEGYEVHVESGRVRLQEQS